MLFDACLKSTLTGIACALALCHGAAAAEPTPATNSWRGFQNGGTVAVEAPNSSLPTHWSPTKNIAWQVPITGYGQSSPVIDGEQIFVTSISGPNKEKCHVMAYRLTTGDKLWQVDFDNPSPIENTGYVSRGAPSPYIDNSTGSLLVAFEGGLVASVTREGTIRWQRNLVEAYGPIASRHGLSASVEQYSDYAFIWIERNENPYLLAVRKSDGETVWKVPGLGGSSWSSPRLVTIDGDQHLVCSATGHLVGFSPLSGERLWEINDVANNSSATPYPVSNGRFLVGASDGRGEESSGRNNNSNGLVEIRRSQDGSFKAKYRWRAAKATSYFGSPIAVGARAVFVNRNGIVFGLDLLDGTEQFMKRTSGEAVWATPIAVENRVYLFGQRGTTTVMSLDNEPTIIATNELWETPTTAAAADAAPAEFGDPILYAAAAAPPYLILRSGDRLYAIRDTND